MLNPVFRPLLGQNLSSRQMIDVFDSVNRLTGTNSFIVVSIGVICTFFFTRDRRKPSALSPCQRAFGAVYDIAQRIKCTIVGYGAPVQRGKYIPAPAAAVGIRLRAVKRCAYGRCSRVAVGLFAQNIPALSYIRTYVLPSKLSEANSMTSDSKSKKPFKCGTSIFRCDFKS